MDSKQSGSEHGDELRDVYAGFEDVGLADDPLQAGPSRRDMDPSSTPSESSTSGFTPQRSSLSTGYSSLDAPLDEQPWASQDDHNVGAPAYPPPRPSTFRPPVSIASSVSATPTHSLQPRLSSDVILGVAVVDFNHLIGPTVEFSYPASLSQALENDQALSRLLPFLALPDGAHLSEEDYSYFHCAYDPPSVDEDDAFPAKQTLFGISCNRQLASADLKIRPDDVTRSTVQKAVVVIASQPVFGPIRDKLGVVTRTYFAQRDFTATDILVDFYKSLENGLPVPTDAEGGMYIGTSLRDLVHKFRHKTLTLLKLLVLQKRILLFGYPVERLCTYQYSLVTLMPGLLTSLQDSGSPELDFRRKKERPTSLRTSDRTSLLRYMGLPLHVFGQDAFFQPYLPLQQIDTLRTKSWLAGTTNQIVTQQRDCKYDLLVNIEHTTFEFSDPKLERLVGLTPADRKWMDDVVKTVEDSWNPTDPSRPSGMAFKGSDDDLRARFEEYICAFLSALKFADFVSQSKSSDVALAGMGLDGNFLQPFSEPWLAAFRQTAAYEQWNKSTDDAIFDICEPRHPCDGKVNAVSDIGLRVAEGLHDLRIDEQLAPAREAISSAFATGSSSLFKAFDGVRTEVSSRLREREAAAERDRAARPPTTEATAPPASADIRTTLGGIGSGIGSFFGSRVGSFQRPAKEETKSGLRPMSLAGSTSNTNLKSAL